MITPTVGDILQFFPPGKPVQAVRAAIITRVLDGVDDGLVSLTVFNDTYHSYHTVPFVQPGEHTSEMWPQLLARRGYCQFYSRQLSPQ